MLRLGPATRDHIFRRNSVGRDKGGLCNCGLVGDGSCGVERCCDLSDRRKRKRVDNETFCCSRYLLADEVNVKGVEQHKYQWRVGCWWPETV